MLTIVCRLSQDLEWTVSMSSSEEDLDDNVFTQQRSLFKSGLDAFMVALHRCAVNGKRSLAHTSAGSPVCRQPVACTEEFLKKTLIRRK